MARTHGLDRSTDATLQLGDHRLDFFGGLLRTLGQVTHLIRHHSKAATLFTRSRCLDGRVERQQVGLLGNAFDHIQHLADRRTVAGQLIDHADGLIDFTRQPLDAADLRLDQRSTADRFIVDALGATHCSGSTVRHFLGSGRHLIHRSGDQINLSALASYRLVTFAGDLLHAVRLTLNLNHGLADTLDQLMDLAHRLIKHLAKLAQLILALRLEADSHIASGHLVHHLTELFQRGADRHIKTAVQVDDQ